MQRVLAVEDDPELRRSLERWLRREGLVVTEACDGRQAAELLAEGAFDLVITDLEMPNAGGREVLDAGLRRGIPVIILTAHSNVPTAVELMRRGAANFLSKPFTPESLRAVIDDAFGRGGAPSGEVVGAEPEFRQVVDTLTQVADTDATILLTGESGSGKEVMARTIHRASRRGGGPFVAINCGAIPEPLLESELFGHAKGAFTGATQARAGRFALASGGTLFLDEIGDMPLGFQVKVLRAIQERQIEPLGADAKPVPVDVRIIAATHRDVKAMVAQGTFRQDLYYRLAVIEIELPPLRERQSDIPLLLEHFIKAANARHGRQVTGISAEALQACQRYPWPGNVRELSNVVERLVILRRTGDLQFADLPAQIARPGAGEPTPAGALPSELPPEGIDLKQAVATLEESLIAQALERTGGNRNAAAQLLGLNRTTLVEKLKRKR